MDIYSLGALLYELASGRPPHVQPTLEELKRAAQERDALPLAEHVPGIDRRFAALVDRCLRRPPEVRFSSAAELLHALEELATTPQQEVAANPQHQPRDPGRRLLSPYEVCAGPAHCANPAHGPCPDLYRFGALGVIPLSISSTPTLACWLH